MPCFGSILGLVSPADDPARPFVSKDAQMC